MKKHFLSICLLIAGGIIWTPTGSAESIGGIKMIDSAVGAFSTDEFKPIWFFGGAIAVAALSGDGDTDLDLYIYDMAGNLVAQDIDHSDKCLASWTPARTAQYRIVVRNRGRVYNRYKLAVN